MTSEYSPNSRFPGAPTRKFQGLLKIRSGYTCHCVMVSIQPSYAQWMSRSLLLTLLASDEKKELEKELEKDSSLLASDVKNEAYSESRMFPHGSSHRFNLYA